MRKKKPAVKTAKTTAKAAVAAASQSAAIAKLDPGPVTHRTELMPPQLRSDYESRRTVLRMHARPDEEGAPEEEWVVPALAGEDQRDTMARLYTTPSMNAALTIRRFNPSAKAQGSLRGLVSELQRQSREIQGNDLSRAEEMLTAQAHTLDSVLADLLTRARNNMGGATTEIAERYMRLALKTQSQCRATWETIAVIKNPTAPIFAKQANIANGPQQVNNGSGPARENVITPNKLLEAGNG